MARKKISKRRRRKLFLYWFIALVLVVAFFANSAKFFSGFISYFTLKPQGAKLTFEKFEGEKITGVILAEPLILVTFDPQVKRLDFFELPNNLYLETGERGFYLASKIYRLSDDSEEGIGILTSTLFRNFLIPVDFYLDFGEEKVNFTKILEWREKILQPNSLLWFLQISTQSPKVLGTNFTLSDQIRLFWRLRNIRKDKFELKKMAPENFEEVILANGEIVVTLAQDGLTPETLNSFLDFKITQENLTVAVFNASDRVGTAQKVAKICQNLGAKAIVGGEAEKTLPTTKILFKRDSAKSKTLKRLVKTLGGGLEEQTDDSNLADIVILVGSDLAVKFFP